MTIMLQRNIFLKKYMFIGLKETNINAPNPIREEKREKKPKMVPSVRTIELAKSDLYNQQSFFFKLTQCDI